MTQLSVVTIAGRQIVVETEPLGVNSPGPGSSTLPHGAELTGYAERLRDATQMIEDTVGALAETALKALKASAPDECSVEIGLSFKGETSPIPVLVKVGGEASVKVTATWKKSAPQG